jgi:mRNA-degrading endonuclease HigB of HigAB toxin-antitoxin module
LTRDIDKLIQDIEMNKWESQTELKASRSDSDCVHSEGFYFFNININRVMILIEFQDGEATVVWNGNHREYENTFRNNKTTIKKWLKDNDWI